MRGGSGCVWNTHICPLLVSLKPAAACSVNRFAKKLWRDLLSSRQLTSCQIVYTHTQGNGDRISKLVRPWGVLKSPANTRSDEFTTVLHHLSHNVKACHNSSWSSFLSMTGNTVSLTPHSSLLKFGEEKVIFVVWELVGSEGVAGLRGVKRFRPWPNLASMWHCVKKCWVQAVAGG